MIVKKEKMSRVGVYVLYHDESSYKKARNHCEDMFPSFLYHKLSDSCVLESSFYLNDLKLLSDRQYDWIGTITYHALEKFHPSKMQDFLRKVNHSVEEELDFDVAVFFNPFPTESLRYQMRSCHPGLYEIFQELLVAMGEDATLLDHHEMTVFYSNLWVARKDITFAYSEWLQKVWETIETTPTLTAALQQQSTYPQWDDRPELLQRLFELPYMPQYPFLFERLPCYFFYSRNCRVRMMEEKQVKEERLGIYVLYHDDYSHLQALLNYLRNFPSFLYHRLSDSHVLENSFYLNDIKTLEIDSYDWIGTITYRANEKFPDTSLYRLQKLLCCCPDFDVAVFFNPFPTESFKDQMVRCHPGIDKIFVAILQAMGEDTAPLDSTTMTVFYANLWVARKEIALAYSEWINKIWEMIETTPSIKTMLQQPSTYPHWNRKAGLLQHIFNLPYMPQYPFVFERLPCYFFYTRNYSVKMM